MSKIKQAFEKGKAFIAFLTAGDPTMEATVEYVLAMEKAGADLIEIGIPFSDPTAEGVVIQEASIRALNGGMNTEKVFEIAAKVRERSQVPLVFMTYLNPVFHYGYEAFCKRCQELGVDGLIIPDLPFDEKEELDAIARSCDMDLISMIAPTSQQRIQMIARQAQGFIYLVSSMGVTGVRSEIKTDVASIVKAIKEVTDVPVAVGFGISTPGQAAAMSKEADGVIVGSAIVRQIEEYKDQGKDQLADYVRTMKAAVSGQ